MNPNRAVAMGKDESGGSVQSVGEHDKCTGRIVTQRSGVLILNKI